MLTTAFHSFLALMALSTGALCARAQITFTTTGTAVGTAGGYTNGQTYTFVYTTGSFANNASSSFNSSVDNWYEDTTGDDQLFTTLTGSGLLGIFTRPVTTFSDPFSQLFVSASNPLLKLQAAADSSNIGLTTLNATPIKLAAVNVTGGVSFFNAGGYDQPASYFSASNNYLGSFPSATGLIYLQGAGFATIETFSITSLTISAIPEPATSAVMLGFGALALVAWRLRQGKTV